MLAEVEEQYLEEHEAEVEMLEERVGQLEERLMREQRARESVEQSAGQVQSTVTNAIDFRRAKRAEQRAYLEKMQPIVIEETEDGADN